MFENTILQGDALETLRKLPDSLVDCVITSPPYWAVRDYSRCDCMAQSWIRFDHRETKGNITTNYRINDTRIPKPRPDCSKCHGSGVDKVLKEYQIGLEPTISEYIKNIGAVFSEVKRVLKNEGSCWVVMGDTYNTATSGNHKWQCDGESTRSDKFHGGGGHRASENMNLYHNRMKHIGQKSLCLIPDRFAISMVDMGWILRNRIIWHKPNAMPSSAKDRFTIDFEHVFFFTKSPRYYFETQYEPIESKFQHRGDYSFGGKRLDGYGNQIYGGKRWIHPPNLWPAFGGKKGADGANRTYSCEQRAINGHGRIKRAVWKIPTSSYSEAHFATFPERLIETPIKATCPVGGTVLDPFMGAGTTALVALKNARKFLGIELNPSYIELANKRIDPFLYCKLLQ